MFFVFALKFSDERAQQNDRCLIEWVQNPVYPDFAVSVA